jgi:hypothetical protein
MTDLFVEIQHVDQKTSNGMTLSSSLKLTKHGVPQGSVFGTLLSLFINDLPHALQEAKVVLFADDINILLTGNELISLNKKILKVRNQLDNWFHENHLIINTDKSKVFFFHGEDQIRSLDPFIC